MNRINMHIGVYSMLTVRLLDILWSNPFGFSDIEYSELSERIDNNAHRINEWEGIRDAIRRPSR